MRDPRTGRVMDVGTATIRQPHALTIVKKAPVKAELAVEVLMPTDGRKMRGYYGRDPDGSWRGQVEDIGSAQDADVSPYAFIRVLDDEAVALGDGTEMTQEMAQNYGAAIERDHQEYEDADYYKLAKQRLEELLENSREMRRDFESGMKAFFGPEWRVMAQKLFPGGPPRL